MSVKLDLAEIMDAVLKQHVAVLGKTGSGKTSTEKLMVEHAVLEEFRVCVLDTTKSDWWGVTSSADGKRAGLPFKILGGPRGHVPLPSSAGKVIGQLVGTGKLPLSIIDMADFEAGGIQRFFVDFAPALMRSMRGVVYLVIEEAHEIAPKERAGFGAENMAIHWAKKLATAGRSKGIRLIVASQRVQALHNAVLGSCETVVAHRLTTPADQKPILDWLKANASSGVLEMVAAQLSSLPTGTAWVCSGEAKIFEHVKFPKFKTYDNTATPTGDGAEIDVKTAAVDQDELRTIIGDAVKQIEADDPKALRAEITKLKGDLAKAPTLETINIGTMIDQVASKGYRVCDPKEIERLRQSAYDEGALAGIAQANASSAGLVESGLGPIHTRIKECADDVGAAIAAMKGKIAVNRPQVPKSVSPAGSTTVVPPSARPPKTAPRATPSPGIAASGDGNLSSSMRETLQALAWWAALGHDQPTRKQLGAIIGVTPTGSTMRSRLAALSNAGLIRYPTEGTVAMTPQGIAAAPRPDMTAGLVETIRQSLTPTERETFDAIPQAGYEIAREELGKALDGIDHKGSTMRSRLAALSNRELIEYPTPGTVARQGWVA